MTKAYSTLTVKSVTDTDDERIITGIATTPSTDRDDDILEPTGAKFALPIPLLWQHNHNQPIGEVISATVTDKGIEIIAKVAKIADDGKLKDRLDEAWQSIKSGLVKCLSVGFKIKEYNYLESSWGLHIKEWEWYELSVVTVPANSDAVITSVKQIKDAFAMPDLPPKQTSPPVSPTADRSAQNQHTSDKSDGSIALILSNSLSKTNGVTLV
ncbi:HK97 family phage prohead protease [Moraxella sp. VT-16-12]|uniref:HK97 family phage prohead protease n=1 Tax=Moraxella sp. VT-16-12 TaxID=2014877 RepID=UPI000B7F5E84|nr:HK97 family phage prohead protease [Moraxella sp. VT-16-12]TWV80428.1 peptidase U35 [Moraxella sp. VT-16-12]